MSFQAAEKHKLQLQEAAVLYLDKTQQLSSLKRDCLRYRETRQNSIYPFTIRINFAEIIDIDATLGNLVLHQPHEARRIFQEACHISLKCLDVLPAGVSCSQVLVNLKINDLPQLESYQLTSSQLLTCKFESRFYKFVGIVCSISTPTKYSRCAKYKCPEPKCYGSADNFYIRCHVEGAKENQTVRHDFNCVYCGSVLIEDVNFRVLGDRCTVRMVDRGVFPCRSATPQVGRFSQSITVVLRDDFAGVQLGGCYSVYGIPFKTFGGNARASVLIEANNVVKVNPSIPEELRCPLPDAISKLLANRRISPWSFSASLAYLFASDIAPPGTYHRLKLCILLSLVNAASRSVAKESPCFLDLLAVGADTNIIRKLLVHGTSLATQAVIHSGGQPLFASLSREPKTSGSCSIDGGSVFLAHQGICMLGDLDCLKRDAREKLQNVIENRVINIDLPAHDSPSASQHLFPVQCHLWSYASLNRSPEIGDDTPFASAEARRNSKQSILESFPIILICDSSNSSKDEHAVTSVIHHTLLGAMQDPHQLHGDNSIISSSDIKQFLELASGVRVEFDATARQLLRGYFVGSRRVRSSGVHGTPFPPMALQTLACMSRSLAKLSLRTRVLEEDATFAVLLYEEAVTARYGYSVLNIQPKPHFKDENISEYLGPENDAAMKGFQAHLSRFCHTHVPDFRLSKSED